MTSFPRWSRILFLLPCLIAFCIAADDSPSQADPPARYNELLKQIVVGNRVDYTRLQRNPQALFDYAEWLKSVDLARLSAVEQKTLYINAYNAFTLQLILENHANTLKSIRDIPEEHRWKARRWIVASQTYSLDQIEHEILRPRFKDPRIHAAINCAAVSCPPLRNEVYDAARLDAQLDEQSRQMVNDPAHVRVQDGKLQLSQIFNWFADDFIVAEGSVVHFVRRYAADNLRQDLASLGEKPTIVYIEYNWDLNAAR